MKNRVLLLIDVGGALVTAIMLATVAWYAFLKPDTASSRMHTLLAQVGQLRADRTKLQSVLDRQTRLSRELKTRAAQRGRLPTKSPVERDLRRITELAGANNVKFLDVAPTSKVRYPGVLELRYRVKAEGTFADHLRFLAAFERCSFWADVTHLKLRQAAPDAQDRKPLCRSDMTLSFFSAVQ